MGFISDLFQKHIFNEFKVYIMLYVTFPTFPVHENWMQKEETQKIIQKMSWHFLQKNYSYLKL